jgi:hypothetical protein
VNNKQIYKEIITLVEHSLDGVFAPAGSAGVPSSQELEQVRANAQQILTQYKSKTEQEIQELAQLSEWDVFTIAFYGETNAGKSTLIESLRILLGEESKAKAQQQFQAIAHGHDFEQLGHAEESIREKTIELEEHKQTAEAFRLTLASQDKRERDKLALLELGLTLRKQNQSWLQKLTGMFRKLEEETAVKVQRAALEELQASLAVKLRERMAEVARFEANVTQMEDKVAEARKALLALAPLQDGEIIGTGRSDFTLQATAYRFQIGNQSFQLLDVPGIEGNEHKVQTEVDASVKKAHVVFYVTRKAAPPGSGSEGQEGTIDKIKRQLGDQTEVWALYNKNAASPRALPADRLLNDGEVESLKAMDLALEAQLGQEVFKGTKALSCIPAFYAGATCLLPSNSHYRNRHKFLEAMPANELLQRSGMQEFVGFLSNDICVNYQSKIRNANLKKVKARLEQGMAYMQELQTNFKTLAENLARQHKSSSAQIDDVRRATRRRLGSECKDCLAERKVESRNTIYGYIENDHSNDDFKLKLQSTIETIKDEVGPALEERFEAVFADMKSKVQAIVEKNKRNVDEIMEYSMPGDLFTKSFSFHLDFKMNNGLNVVDLLSSLGGATTLVIGIFSGNPVVVAIGAVTLVFQIYKSVRSFFSSAYKMEQQRASADDNLDRVFEKLEEAMLANINNSTQQLDEALAKTKMKLKLPLQQSLTTVDTLAQIDMRMSQLKNRIA